MNPLKGWTGSEELTGGNCLGEPVNVSDENGAWRVLLCWSFPLGIAPAATMMPKHTPHSTFARQAGARIGSVWRATDSSTCMQ